MIIGRLALQVGHEQHYVSGENLDVNSCCYIGTENFSVFVVCELRCKCSGIGRTDSTFMEPFFKCSVMNKRNNNFHAKLSLFVLCHFYFHVTRKKINGIEENRSDCSYSWIVFVSGQIMGQFKYYPFN